MQPNTVNASRLYQLPEQGKVHTLHILEDGEIISSLEAFMKVEERFSWVNKSAIVSSILKLHKLTDDRKQSVVVVYESGRRIKEFVNIDTWFNPFPED